jgi:hypothetical protein
MKTANSYRDQLDRTRRWLEKVRNQTCRYEVEYQDEVWAFFQACWHLKDWVKNDKTIPEPTKKAVIDAAHASPILMICRDLACGAKHLKLDDPRAGAGASHMYVETLVQSSKPEFVGRVDTFIDPGDGSQRSGLAIAAECLAEWERILTGVGLSIVRRT